MRLPPDEAKLFIDLYCDLIGWCARRLDPKSKIHDAASFRDAPMSDKGAARDRMLAEPSVLDEYVTQNPDQLGPEALERVSAWRWFKRGKLFIERDLKRYTIFLDSGAPPVAYGVLSLTDEIVDLLPLPPPMLVEAVLLPWGDAIVCDGLVYSHRVYLGPGIRSGLRDAYREAKARGIVTSLGEDSAAPPKSKPATPTKSPGKTTRPGASKKRGRSTNPKQAFVGRWRVEEMGTWEEDSYEVDKPPFIEVERSGRGTFELGLLKGVLDARFSIEDGRPQMELSWEGRYEGEPVCGRGRFRIEESGQLRGRMFIHLADESDLVARKETTSRKGRR